jgi:hypothetical protein
VYHIRGEQMLHQTTDHSLVNELVRAKQITPEEALNHPRRNVITRAIQGSGRPSSITVYITQDVAPGDYFFLCTDGVLECLRNEDLLRILSTGTLTDSQKISHIMRACFDGSRDNFSGYLIHVAEVVPLAALPDPADALPPLNEDVPTRISPPTANVPTPASVPEPSGDFSLLLDDPTPRERGWLQRLFS